MILAAKHVRASWKEILAVTAILLLAAFLRLYRLDELPPGLHYDEAFNATEAQKVLAGGERPLFFTGDLTEEPMAIYVTSIFFGLFGVSPWTLRLVSAVAGTLTVAALYALARSLFASRFAAALAALTLAILYWHVNFSRLGMEPIFLPLMLTLAFAFLWRGLTPHPLPPFPLPPLLNLNVGSGEGGGGERGRGVRAGFFLAATMYTYKSSLFVPLLVAAFLGLEILVQRGFWARHRRGLAVVALVAVLAFAPLGLYFVTHPSEFLERPGSVMVSAPLDNVGRVTAMFFVQGDENPRSNLPLRPALDPFLAIGFVAGLVACVVRIRKPEARFMLLWLGVMVLPSVLTDFAPHFGRSIGATPAIALIVAYGFTAILAKLPRQNWLLLPGYCLLAAGMATSSYATVHDYFDVWGSRTGLFDSFDVGHLSLARKMRERPANEVLYLSPVAAENYTIQFGLAGRAARSFDGRQALVVPPPGTAAAYGIITRDDSRSIARLAALFPKGNIVATLGDFTGKPYAAIWRADDAPRIAPQKVLRARVGETIELIGYDVAREEGAVSVTVYWGSSVETDADYTVFVHLIGPNGLVTQDDARPGHGSYPTSQWQAGQVIVDDYRLAVPRDLAPGEYQIEIGMYILKTGARVRLTDANGAPMENDRVHVEGITLP
ncbi:MAG: glycosyltransferase family 39 protein [Chloroflexi bacterium]|nr:glycosyltransferase family 39 protein [Chloroflexota bacterium]